MSPAQVAVRVRVRARELAAGGVSWSYQLSGRILRSEIEQRQQQKDY